MASPLKQLKRTLCRSAQSAFVRYAVLRERLESGVAFNPLDPALAADPYPAYRKLRERDPIHKSRIVDIWVLSRYEDVDAILRDHKRFSNDDRNARDKRMVRSAEVPSMLRLDPPDHTRLRSLVSNAFTPQAIERLRPRIEAIMNDVLLNLCGKQQFDVVREIAEPLPVTVIAEMLGIPTEDRNRFRAWSHDIERGLEPNFTEAEALKLRRARAEIEAYFDTIIDQRRAHPSDDLLSALISAEDKGARLTHDELISTLILLLIAGNVTTTGLIGNGMLALLRNPEQLQRLRADLSLMDSAIEEMLRYDSPVQIDSRIALEDMQLGGKQIRKGQSVLMLLGEANRDPDVFPNPDQFDIGRSGRPHIAFGRGVHYCLGAPLARVEAYVAFQKLLQHFPNLRMAEAPTFGSEVVIRNVKRLVVAPQGSSIPLHVPGA